MKKISVTKNPAPTNRINSLFSFKTCFETEFREFASIFVPLNRILSSFLFRGMVQNGIPRVCFYFCSYGTEFRVFFSFVGMVRNGITKVFCSAEQLEFRRNKPIVPSIPSSME
jgi:hypothetical protein